MRRSSKQPSCASWRWAYHRNGRYSRTARAHIALTTACLSTALRIADLRRLTGFRRRCGRHQLAYPTGSLPGREMVTAGERKVLPQGSRDPAFECCGCFVRLTCDMAKRKDRSLQRDRQLRGHRARLRPRSEDLTRLRPRICGRREFAGRANPDSAARSVAEQAPTTTLPVRLRGQ